MTFLRDLGPSDRNEIEQEMLDELYRQMVKVVRHKLYRKSDVGDVVQEAWVRILEKLDTLRDTEKLIPWAKTIAYNLASNANRARRASRYLDGDEDFEAKAPQTPNPELMMELSDLLGRLDPTTRTLILYKFYYGFSDEEIAAALEMPVGTIKSRIHRGRARLKAEDREDPAHT